MPPPLTGGGSSLIGVDMVALIEKPNLTVLSWVFYYDFISHGIAR